MNEDFDKVLNNKINEATDIQIRYERYGKIIAKYNKNQRKQVKELLKEHDCYNFTSGIGDGYLAITITKPGYRLCRYCGNQHKTKDPEILCPECRETFGHTFYSEL